MVLSNRIVIIVISAVIVLVACAGGKKMILTYQDTQFFHADYISPNRLEISGLAFHSSFVIKNIEATQRGREINVSVYLRPANGDGVGNFKYVVDIPSSVTLVTFGSTHEPIWRRSSEKMGQ